MPYCPKCKNEYREGITVCSDCGCELITDNEPERQKLIFGEKEEMENLAEFLQYSQIEGVAVSYDGKDNVYELLAAKKDIQKAEKLIGIYYQQKWKEDAVKKLEEETAEETDGEKAKPARSTPYENSAAKAEDNKSSAYTLLLVGILGMLAVVLGIAGVLPIHLSGTSKYMTYGIMSALFLLFIVMGVTSMKSYRIFAKKAESENSLKNTIEKWSLDNLSAEKLDEKLAENHDSELSEEEKYFKRTTLMKEMIQKQFMNLDEAFLDSFVDEIYEDIFEE